MITLVRNLFFLDRKKEKLQETEATEAIPFSVEEELKYYLEPEEAASTDPLSTSWELFAKEVKHFGQEQSKTTTQLEELLSQMEEQLEKSGTEELLKTKLTAAKKETQTLLLSLLSNADALEEVYRYAQENAAPWQEQLALQWQKLGQTLSHCGLVRIEGQGEAFQPQLQIAIGLDSDLALPEETVLGIVKSGYFYQGELLRKAEVIVNKHQPVEEKEDSLLTFLD